MAPPRFHRLVIHGVGLLGGSLGMALRRRGMVGQVVGLGRSMERLERARQLGAIDEGQTQPAAALEGADAFVLAIPPRQIRERWAELATMMRPGMFVTDVGSVKARIVAEAERTLPAGVHFIGSHPMAGSEKTGVEQARGDFYEGSACFLTPTARTAPEALELGRGFWEAVGARVVEMEPQAHDELLAGVSHLPHLLAAALMQTLARGNADGEPLAGVVGRGLRDTTRIAAADPETWRQIFAENAPAMLGWLDRLEDVLGEWRTALSKSTPDARTLGTLYEEGRTARLGLDREEQQSGSPTSLIDCLEVQ